VPGVRAVVCTEFGPLDRLVVEEREPPTAGEGNVVVAVRAAGVNYVDGLICEGRYQMKPATPFVPGSEIAGEITAVGPGVEGLSVGDRVLAFTGFGGFAEQVALPAASVIPMPASLDFGQAATLVQSYSTVLFALTRRTSVAAGEWVLVLGAGGGIGLAAVDVARALGARVIAAASNDARLDAARAMGAEAFIDYEREDLKTAAREIAGGGVDLVIDPVGGRHSEAALRATRLFGRFCVIGFAAGSIASIPLNLVLLQNRTLVGVEWGGWAIQDAAGNAELFARLLVMLEDGRLHPTQPATFALTDAPSVLAGLIGRSIDGKAVLVP
jgi:NADPH2:quinone reductase